MNMAKLLIITCLLIKYHWMADCFTAETLNETYKDRFGNLHEYLVNNNGKIGEGTFGAVYLKNWPIDNKGNTIKVAVKVAAHVDKAQELLIKEIDFLQNFGKTDKIAQFLPNLWACVHDGPLTYYVMEYFPCSFENFIPNKKVLTLNRLCNIEFSEMSAEVRFLYYREMIRAVAALHASGKVHHDLKPGNIVFATDGDIRVKLIDFGLVEDLEIPLRGGSHPYMYYLKHLVEYYLSTEEETIPQDQLKKFQEKKNKALDKWKSTTDFRRADVWALGILIYVLEQNHSAITTLKSIVFKSADVKENMSVIVDKIHEDNWIKEGELTLKTNEYFFPTTFHEIVQSMIKLDQSKIESDLKVLLAKMDLIYLDNHLKIEQERINYLFGPSKNPYGPLTEDQKKALDDLIEKAKKNLEKLKEQAKLGQANVIAEKRSDRILLR